MPKLELDRIDRQILTLLQHNGRLSNLEIADQVNLSPSPCLRRIRRLEEAGVIRGYVALLEPARLGLGLLAYVNVRLDKRGQPATADEAPSCAVEQFRRVVDAWPEVVGCYAMAGDMDYLLRVHVSDMTHFSRFMHDHLLKHPTVVDVKSSFVLDHLKETTALPVA